MRKEKSLDVDSIWALKIYYLIERGVTMIELLKEFKKVEGNKGTKRPDFFYQFGCFKIKKLALTKENLKKVNGGTDKQGREIEPRNTWFYLIDTRKVLANNRVSGVFWENENIFLFDTYSGKNLNDYKLGFYKGTISSDKIKIQEITKQEFEEIKEYNLKELA